MKVAAAIQARLGSSRLPEKALLELNGVPLIDHIIKQVKVSTYVNDLVLTTSDQELDKKLINHFINKNFKYFAGAVDDIIGRLYGVIQLTDSDVLVRIWGDCPFVCSDIIDAMLNFFKKNQLDFLSNSEINNRTFPPGLDIEIYSAKLLKSMNANVTDKAQREFPIEYVKSQKNDFKYKYFHLSDLNYDQNLYISKDLHLTIDYADDLSAAEIIFKKLCTHNETFNFNELSRFINSNPELFKLFSTNERNIEYKKYLQQKAKAT